MESITRKPEIRTCIQSVLEAYDLHGVESAVATLHQLVLSKKVKFPLLEYAAMLLFERLAPADYIAFCDEVEGLKTIGGNVILGIVLQKHADAAYNASIENATRYISQADAWYVCDIIGERVFGYLLLHRPDETIPVIRRLSQHPSNWVVRSLGAGAHYATKKGLPEEKCVAVFRILLSMANTQDKEIRQGVGWAAKTTAKFHPGIIRTHWSEINDPVKVSNWFRAKIAIGLNRFAYAKRD